MDGDVIAFVVALLVWGGSALLAVAGKAAKKARQAQQAAPTPPRQHEVLDPDDHTDIDEEAYEEVADEEPGERTLQEILSRRISEVLGGAGAAEQSSHTSSQPGRVSTEKGEFVDDLGNPVFSFDQDAVEQDASPFAAYQGYGAAATDAAAIGSPALSSAIDEEGLPLDDKADDGSSLIQGANIRSTFDLRQAVLYDAILHNENIDYLHKR